MSLIQQLHNLCVEKDISISTAESCTAGLLASKITSLPGASFFFKGGIISYQKDVKINLLNISSLIINEKTEVSFEVVEKMAIAVRNKLPSDFSVSTSGYAGPEGGGNINPVGTVFIAISSNNKTISERFIFSGDRESIINQCVFKGLELLIREIKKYR